MIECPSWIFNFKNALILTHLTLRFLVLMFYLGVYRSIQPNLLFALESNLKIVESFILANFSKKL